MQHDRNFVNINMANIRQTVDHCVNAAHDELEDAYYKFWKQGLSYNYYGYDKKPTVAESKEQFDLLHGMLFRVHSVLLHNYNMSLPAQQQVPTAAYNDIFDQNGVKIGEVADQELTKLKSLTPHFINVRDIIKNKATNSTVATLVGNIR